MKGPVSAVFLCLSLMTLLTLSSPAFVWSAGYVGTDACKDCHETLYASYAKTVHSKKAVPGGPPVSQGCESCHGPGSAHVDAGGGKGVGGLVAFGKDEPSDKKSAACLNCHSDTKSLNSWRMGTHGARGVSCVDCHSGHTGNRSALKAREPDACLSCHRQVRSQIDRQSHHPIREGKVKCTDCHSPHGATTKKMLRADSVNEACFTCHQDKRGPFPFEHPPVAENCVTCHQPHGSNHENLLTRKAPQLCQGCHNLGVGHTSRAYTAQHGFGGNATANKNKFFAQGCLNCHGNIHGSNRSPQFLR